MSAPGPVSAAFTPATISALGQVRMRARSLAASGIQGRRRSLARGRSQEFADHRPYTPGDEPRDLDWNAVARFDSLLVRLFHAEVALPMRVLVDGSASMAWGGKRTYGLQLAAAMGLISLADDTPVSVRLVEAGNESAALLATAQRRAGFPALTRRMDEWCERAGTADQLGLAKALDQAIRGRGAQTVVVITDGYEAEALLPRIGALRSAGAEVDVILALHPEELRPGQRGDFALVDADTGQETRLTVDGRALEEYRKRLARFIAGWRLGCRRRGAGFALVSTDAELGPALASALVASGSAIGRTHA